MKPPPEEPVIPEVIADTLTRDRNLSDALAARFHFHWRSNKQFRRSFARRDERDQCAVWMRHWLHDEQTTLRYLDECPQTPATA